MVKAHIGSKILTSIVQESQTNIQPASESDSDSDRVERMVGSTSISSELNYSGDQRIVNMTKTLKKRYLSLVRLDADSKGHESAEKTVCHGIIYM